MKKETEETEIKSKLEAQIPEEMANPNLDEQGDLSLDPLENYSQGVHKPIYQSESEYRSLLLHFQQGEWDECLKMIDQLQASHPQDTHLISFRRDVEVRHKLQTIQHDHQMLEARKQKLPHRER